MSFYYLLPIVVFCTVRVSISFSKVKKAINKKMEKHLKIFDSERNYVLIGFDTLFIANECALTAQLLRFAAKISVLAAQIVLHTTHCSELSSPWRNVFMTSSCITLQCA